MILRVIHSNPRSSSASLVTAAVQVPFEEASSSVRFLQTKFLEWRCARGGRMVHSSLVQKHSNNYQILGPSDCISTKFPRRIVSQEFHEHKMLGFCIRLIVYNRNKCWTGLFFHARGLSCGAQCKDPCNTVQYSSALAGPTCPSIHIHSPHMGVTNLECLETSGQTCHWRIANAAVFQMLQGHQR